MKLPLKWLRDYLDADDESLGQALKDACDHWDLEHFDDHARTLGLLLTFAGFECEAVDGENWDAVLDLSVLANRPDCQGVLGLAREVATILRVPIKLPVRELKSEATPVAELAKLRVEDPQLCTRYTARVIRNVKVGPSPAWMKERLEAMGLTPRNNIVDITNFVLFEYNQPLHAFDLKKLKGAQIVVRRAAEKETFKPLYGEIAPLTAETLVIADTERPVAVAGIIGGAGSEVDESTTEILLETACFDPANTRRTCRKLKVADGKGTDSSYRFERGIDIEAIGDASSRAAHLICELAGGTVAEGLLDSNPTPREEKVITLRLPKLHGVYGVKLGAEDACAILQSLGCKTQLANAEDIAVSVPSWRRGDLEREIDLIEEIARLNGYHHVPAVTAMSARIPPRSTLEIVTDRLRDLFPSLGYFECVTDSLIDPRWPTAHFWTTEPGRALDPKSVMREDHSMLRTGLLPSLLTVTRHNQDRRTGTARLFECGKVFVPRSSDGSPVDERPVLGLVDAKGFAYLADALGRMADGLSFEGGSVALKPTDDAARPNALAADGACRVMRVRETEDGERAEDAIGWIGLLSPAFTQAFGLRDTPAVAEMDLHKLASMPFGPARCQPLPTQPEVVRDVALVVNDALPWHDIERFAHDYLAHEPLRDKHETPRFLSVFRGKQIGDGKKSLAFSVVYRAAERSLTDEEVNAAHSKFVDALCSTFDAAVRK